MNREQARQRLEQTTDFTFVGGRVRITDRRVLAAISEIRAEMRAAEHGLPRDRQDASAPAQNVNRTAA